jgi:hypothetical protein
MADPLLGFRLAQQGINLVPGVPLPSDNKTSGTGLSSGNGTSSSRPSAPAPRKVQNFEIKQKLLRPALTSHFQCWFNPPRVPEIQKYYLGGGETISLLCSDASLPGSSIVTNEINDDFTGVTERLGYRRSYDDRSDFTFYVDHGTANGGYNVIRFFESWIRYSMGETSEAPDRNYHYRVRYPDEERIGYRTEMFLQKFERDFFGNYLEYIFVRAYPIGINSMQVSYNNSELLRCTVSFTYNRYVLKSISGSTSSTSEPSPIVIPGIPTDSQFEIDSSGLYDKTAQSLINEPLYNKSAGSGALF